MFNLCMLNVSRARSSLQQEVSELRGRQSELRGEAAYLEALVQRYEQRIFDLEEVEVELREKLTLLEQASCAEAWVNSVLPRHHQQGLKELPLLIAFDERGTQTMVVESDRKKLEEELEELKTQKEVLAKSLESKNEDKTECVARLEGEIAKLMEQAQKSNEKSVEEIKHLKEKLQGSEAIYKERIRSLEGRVKVDEGLEAVEEENVNVLKSELSELQAKEAAYSQTIQEADTILAKVERNYQETIAELQAETEALRERLQTLTGQDQLVKESLKTLGSEGESHKKLAEVLEKLLEAERQVLELKERVYSLEKTERELSLRLMKSQQEGAEARAQLHEQELLVSNARKMATEREEALEELSKMHGMEKKLLDVQQSEGLLRGRVEEMEATEATLREGLVRADRELAERERQWQTRVDRMREELRDKDDACARSQQEEAAKRNALRLEVEGLSTRLCEVERAAEVKGAEAEQNEASYRSEVSIPSERANNNLASTSSSKRGSLAASSSTRSGGGSFCLTRYRSIRDHTGRYFLVVKIS